MRTFTNAHHFSHTFSFPGKVDTTVGSFMRQIIAESISSNKEEYCDAILGEL